MKNVKKVLIIKLSALGDAVMASSLLAALRSRYGEDIHITWLAGSEIAELVALYKGVDELWTVDNSLLARGLFGRLKFVLSVWKILFAKRYDLAITAHSNSKYWILSYSAFCKKRVHFGGRSGPIPGRYHAAEYARLAFAKDSELTGHFPFAELKEIKRAEVGKGFFLLLPGGALNLMCNISLRRWGTENYVELAGELIKRGYKVGLIGAKTDLWVERFFEGLDVASFIGKTGIAELIAIISNARAVITHDSGPFHITCMTDTPLVGLFGPIDSKLRAPPQKKNLAAIDAKTICSPCYDGRFYADCVNNICMRSITVEEVLEKLRELGVI
jgi:heptosyltransferase-2